MLFHLSTLLSRVSQEGNEIEIGHQFDSPRFCRDNSFLTARLSDSFEPYRWLRIDGRHVVPATQDAPVLNQST